MFRLLIILLLGNLSVVAQQTSSSITAGPQDPFTGTFTANIEGAHSTLTLQNQQNTVHGTIVEEGSNFVVTGQYADGVVIGKLVESDLGLVLDIRINPIPNGISLEMLLPDANGVLSPYATIPYYREGYTTAPGAATTDSQGSPAVNTDELDPNVIGHWIYTEFYSSGDFSASTEFHMQINPDGTYFYGDGQVYGGGNLGSFNSGNSGDGTTGRWKAKDGIIYIMEGNDQNWTPYAKYYVEGNSMLFTFGDGSRQLWKR